MTKSGTAVGRERYVVASPLPLILSNQRQCRSASRAQLAFPMCKKPSRTRRGLQTHTCSSSCC